MRIRNYEEVTGIMAHIMDSNFPSHDGLKGVDALRQWHVTENGWSDIGYHFFIDSDGIIHNCRDSKYTGAHCPKRGANRTHIGVCFFGKSGDVTEKQFESFRALAIELQWTLCPNMKSVNQHSDFDPVRRKYCAGIPQDWLDNLEQDLLD